MDRSVKRFSMKMRGAGPGATPRKLATGGCAHLKRPDHCRTMKLITQMLIFRTGSQAGEFEAEGDSLNRPEGKARGWPNVSRAALTACTKTTHTDHTLILRSYQCRTPAQNYQLQLTTGKAGPIWRATTSILHVVITLADSKFS